MQNKIAITVAEAVSISGLGRTTIYRLFTSGSLTKRKSGRKTLILMEELEQFIKNLPEVSQ